jgi:hypothetical protein
MMCLKSRLKLKLQQIIVLIKQRTRHFNLMAVITINNVGLLKQLLVAGMSAACGDLL